MSKTEEQRKLDELDEETRFGRAHTFPTWSGEEGKRLMDEVGSRGRGGGGRGRRRVAKLKEGKGG